MEKFDRIDLKFFNYSYSSEQEKKFPFLISASGKKWRKGKLASNDSNSNTISSMACCTLDIIEMEKKERDRKSSWKNLIEAI